MERERAMVTRPVGGTSTKHMYGEETEKKTVEEIICVNETQRHI